MTNRPTSRQIQGHFNALRATRSHTSAERIDIAPGNYASGKIFPGVVATFDPAWTGATSTFYIYLDQNHDLVLDGSEFPTLCTKIARIIIASGIIIDVIDERAEVNGLIDAYQIAFYDADLNIATPADDIQEAIELLDAYVWSMEPATAIDIIKYIDLDIGGGIRNALVKLGHLDDAPAVEFPNRHGVGRVRYTVSVPYDWVSGTDIVIKLFWSPADANIGDVNWQIRYKVITSNLDNVSDAMTVVYTAQAAPGVVNRLVNTGDSLKVSGGSVAAGDMIVINVERDNSVVDTFNSTARIHLVRLEYTGRGIDD